MLNEPTFEKLQLLRLYAMAQAWKSQQHSTNLHELTFDERFALLVDAEQLARHNRRLARSLREAKLRISTACLEDIDYSAQRELDKTLLRELSSCRFVEQHLNVVITGATGTGKTFLSCALGQQACRKGYRVLYRRIPRLLEEFSLAHADGSYGRLLQTLAKSDLLVLDDWGLSPLRDPERRDLLEILEDRYDLHSTVVTSQLPTAHWHSYLGEPTLADAICDRLLHNAHRIVLKGPSRRKEASLSH